jgi:hypothetical protein
MQKFFITLLITVLTIPAFAKKKGSPPMAAGALGDRTCAASKCHASYELNSGDAEISIEGLPDAYKANEIYDLTLSLKQKKAKVFGFQATVSDDNGNAVGQLISIKGENTQLLDDARYKSQTNRQYITHTNNGIKAPKKGISQTWKIQWQAPDTAAVNPSFYFAFNAGNGNNKKTGDKIYTRKVTVSPSTE